MQTLQPGETHQIEGARRGRVVRRITVAGIAAFVLAGMFGVFGYRQSTTAAHTGDFDIELSYPSVTRAGLPSHWELDIHRRGDAPIGALEIRTSADYLDAFDHNDLVPTPDSVEQTATDVIWTYERVESPTLAVTLDIRTQPNARWRHPASTQVVIDGDVVATFDYRTTVAP